MISNKQAAERLILVIETFMKFPEFPLTDGEKQQQV